MSLDAIQRVRVEGSHRGQVWACSKCFIKAQKWKSDLKNHWKRHHAQYAERKYRCRHCKAAGFDHPGGLSNHNLNTGYCPKSSLHQTAFKGDNRVWDDEKQILVFTPSDSTRTSRQSAEPAVVSDGQASFGASSLGYSNTAITPIFDGNSHQNLPRYASTPDISHPLPTLLPFSTNLDNACYCSPLYPLHGCPPHYGMYNEQYVPQTVQHSFRHRQAVELPYRKRQIYGLW
ncbi:hypothetical protein JCM3765_001540 [Sporobolomyces pararoseus]